MLRTPVEASPPWLCLPGDGSGLHVPRLLHPRLSDAPKHVPRVCPRAFPGVSPEVSQEISPWVLPRCSLTGLPRIPARGVPRGFARGVPRGVPRRFGLCDPPTPPGDNVEEMPWGPHARRFGLCDPPTPPGDNVEEMPYVGLRRRAASRRYGPCGAPMSGVGRRTRCGPCRTSTAGALRSAFNSFGVGGMHKLFSSPPSTLSPGGVGGTHKLFGVCGVCVRSRSVCGACGAQGQSGQVSKRNIRTMKVHNFWHPDRYKPAGYPTILENNGRVSLF